MEENNGTKMEPKLLVQDDQTEPAQEIIDLIKQTEIFLFDCDGVLWLGDMLIPGADLVLAGLEKLSKKVFFLTNNSTKSRRMYVSKFHHMGFAHVRPQKICSSAWATAAYLHQMQ